MVGKLRDDKKLAAATIFFDVNDRSHRDRSATGAVSLVDTAAADDKAARREVGALDPLHQRFEEFFARDPRVLKCPLRARGDLAQVVRRNVRRHADGDARGAIDQQVRETGRQNNGFELAAVVIRREIDSFFADIAQHFHRERREPALRVAHRGSGVVARRAEVTLPVDQRMAHHPRLGQPHQRVVDRGVAVRVVTADDVTHHAGALEVAAVGPVAAVEHGVEHPAVHRLEAVAHFGQRSADNDAHRVVEIAALHLDLEVDRLDAAALRRQRGVLAHGVSFCARTAGLLFRCRESGRPWRCAE